MLKKTITYTDYEGNERTEDFYFNLTTAEIAKMNLAGEAEKLDRTDVTKVVNFYEKIILGAYGEKSDDGKHFYKTAMLTSEFASSPAYDELFIELMNDEDRLMDFISGIVPKAIAEKLTKVRTELS